MIIWIASYPRSGNTFLRVILKSVFELETYSIYDDKSAIAKDAATSEIVGHKMLPDNFDLEAARNSDQLYLIKTHDVIPHADDKAIYLVRDGRQCALSYMNYINSFLEDKCGIRDVLYGNVPFGSWGEHIGKWNPNHRHNTLLLKFEDLTASPQLFLDQISRFIGVERKAENIPGFEELHNINPKFFWQGKSDSWKAELTQDDVHIFWMNSFSQMRALYPKERVPELFIDDQQSLQFNKIFADQSSYFQDVVAGLRLQASEKEGKLEVLEKEVSSLKAQLNETRDRLASIRFSIAEMINVKAWKSPFRKYRMYQKVLETFFMSGE